MHQPVTVVEAAFGHSRTGANVAIGLFPAPFWHRGDSGRFIGLGSVSSAGHSGMPAAISVTLPISPPGSAPWICLSAPSLPTQSMNSRKSLYSNGIGVSPRPEDLRYFAAIQLPIGRLAR